jgi:hypothetical protein
MISVLSGLKDINHLSVLGPLLCLVYINDIGDKLLSLCRLFADDTSIGYANQDEDQIKYVINHDLHELGY